MAAVGDLTTLANVKAWLNTNSASVFPTTNDVLLARAISAASMFAKTWLSMPVVPATYVETRNGTGTGVLFLRNRPVLAVTAITLDNVALAPSSPPSQGYGFMNDDTRAYLVGGCFRQGVQNVVVTYSAGFQLTDQVTLAASMPVSALSQTWTCDRGVTVAGVSFVPVSGAPAAGQYQVAQANGAFSYNFNAGDVGKAASLSYGYVPYDLEQGVIELTCERFKTRDRIGQVSMNIGNGQTVSYSQKDMNDNVKTLLGQYRQVVPV